MPEIGRDDFLNPPKRDAVPLLQEEGMLARPQRDGRTPAVVAKMQMGLQMEAVRVGWNVGAEPPHWSDGK
jgi:hypothetical protein